MCGPSLTKAGMKPLKKACGPCLAVNVTKPRAPLNSPKEKKSNMSTPKYITIKEGILEAKTECYEKDNVKSLPFFRSFFQQLKVS